MVNVVVADLDGTLLNSDHRVSGFTQEIVRSLIDRGIKFIIATGRHRRDIEPMIQSVGSNIFSITSNGARIHDKDGNLFHSENIRVSVVRKILSLTAAFSVHRNVYCGEQWYVET